MALEGESVAYSACSSSYGTVTVKREEGFEVSPLVIAYSVILVNA
jgi:hypothetical protein